MDRRYGRQAGIVRVQRGCHGRKAGHQGVGSDIFPIGAARRIRFLPGRAPRNSIAPLDQRCPAQNQAFIGAGGTEIVLAAFAQTPHPNHAVYVP